MTGSLPVRESARKQHALSLFAGLPRSYDRVGALLSFGQDPRWRRALVAAVDPGPTDTVLDVATGTALVAEELVERSGCSVVGVDQSPEMLAGAHAKLAARPDLARRVELRQAEAERLPFADGEFDALTFTYLLRYVDDPGATLRELARVVRPGGRIASLEFAVPEARPWRALWALYTRAGLPALGRFVSRDWWRVGRFLGPSIREFDRRYPLPALMELWRAAGIGSVEARRMSLGGGLVMWGRRDGGAPRAHD
jgi:demethylmenaquinone methyltransferase / 2-methoxy-6-polyprenyl-1,4-benzoquinol methylase